jgi:hypothetical protein
VSAGQHAAEGGFDDDHADDWETDSSGSESDPDASRSLSVRLRSTKPYFLMTSKCNWKNSKCII